MLGEGRSLGEIQHALQMKKPAFKAKVEADERRKEALANKELQDILGDPLKDPMEDLVDNLVAMADETRNATAQAAIDESQKEA